MLTYPGAKPDGLLQRHAVRQRTLGCALNNGAVGDRIREGYPKLNHVRARLLESENEIECDIEVWISRRNERNETLLAGQFQLCEFVLDARHQPWDSCASLWLINLTTSATSLSPRPEILTTTI